MPTGSRGKRMDQARTRADAKDSKKNVSLNKVEARQDWIKARSKKLTGIQVLQSRIKNFQSSYKNKPPSWFIEDDANRREFLKSVEDLLGKLENTVKEIVKLQKEAKAATKHAKDFGTSQQAREYKIVFEKICTAHTDLTASVKTIKTQKTYISKPLPPTPIKSYPIHSFDLAVLMGAFTICYAAVGLSKLFKKLK